MVPEMEDSWTLSAELTGHDSDVRCVFSRKPGELLSASRDRTLRSWKREGKEWKQDRLYLGHKSFVSAITAIPASKEFPDGLIVSAGYDRTIKIHDPDHPEEPLTVLHGHSDTVCCLDVDGDGTIISGSWDKTAKIWTNYKCQYTLLDHGQAVWAVLVYSSGRYITASADKAIRLYKNDTLLKTITGHSDVVRGLVKIPEVNGFASCSNDGSCRLWDMEGNCLKVLYGHSSFVYDIARLSNTSHFVSCGEDRSVRIWKDTESIQVISLPATSVWSVCGLDHGDFAVATSDGIIRVFTNDPARKASREAIAKLEDALSNFAVASETVGDLDKSKIPGRERLLVRGTKDGQTVMIRDGARVEAHQWSMAQNDWIKIGDVVDAVGSASRKQLHNGKEYDFVFDVDVEDGKPPLKLPYNVNENVYEAAKRFIQLHSLPISYLDQVAAFIDKNTKGARIGTSQQAPGFVDPFTGDSRYQPGVSSSAHPPSATSGNSKQTIFPMKDPVRFQQANIPSIMSKLKEFNGKVDGAVRLDEGNLAKLEDAAKDLTSAQDTLVWGLLCKVLSSWPAECRFPALDLLRVWSATSPSVRSSLLGAGRFGHSYLYEFSLVPSGEPKTDAIMAMLGLRAFANVIGMEPSRARPLVNDQELLSALLRLHQSQNLNLKTAILSFLFNVSIALNDGDVSFGATAMDLTLTILEQTSNEQNLYRGLAVVGNLISLNFIETSQVSQRILALLSTKSWDAKAQPLAGALKSLMEA